MSDDKQNQATPALAVAPCSASGPRLRCIERSPRLFYGRYKGHEVGVERDHKGRWCFLVICPDGTRAADGITREPCSQREAIIYALRGALLWPNVRDEQRARTENKTQ